ncbi:MAG TPA: HAMP domain-containing sensor histidine kinase [Thermoleophilaceae bacterium]
MKRSLSLHVWLGLALALVVAAPALAGVAAWAAAGSWQAGWENHRERQALLALKGLDVTNPLQRDAVTRRLNALGVEAQLGPNGMGAEVPVAAAAKLALSARPVLLTSAVKTGESKQTFGHYRQAEVALPNVAGLLWVPRESAATRWAITLGAGLLALVAALVAVVVLLRSWVLRPLARLAADAERIAGGELDVERLDTRAREVAEVGDALLGMAGGLRDAVGRSAAAERERRFMVTAIAHDLRTPLFTLRGSLEALERGVGDGRYLDRAQNKAAHLDRLVSDLFTFSRLEYAREAIAFDEVDVAQLTRRAAEDVEALATARGSIVQVGDVTPELMVRGDADALLRVLTNLLDNAIRHGRGLVVVSGQRVNGAVRIEVADNGPGFDPGDLPHVFEPLFRSDRARPAATGGAGLGLAIARRLARAHGGDVEAANDPGGGARTTVTLPRA